MDVLVGLGVCVKGRATVAVAACVTVEVAATAWIGVRRVALQAVKAAVKIDPASKMLAAIVCRTHPILNLLIPIPVQWSVSLLIPAELTPDQIQLVLDRPLIKEPEKSDDKVDQRYENQQPSPCWVTRLFRQETKHECIVYESKCCDDCHNRSVRKAIHVIHSTLRQAPQMHQIGEFLLLLIYTKTGQTGES